MFHLNSIGWDPSWTETFEPYAALGYQPGRVVVAHKHLYRLSTADGERLGHLAGRFRHEAEDAACFPGVGDWVACAPVPGEDKAVIQAVLPRRSAFFRRAVGSASEPQLVAANVAQVLLVSALNHDFNLRRLERYLTVAWDSGARPVVVLNKADLHPDVPEAVASVAAIAPGVPIFPVSCATGEGLDALRAALPAGASFALLGSSGVGKSSLLNALAGEERQRTQAARAGDDRGRHTTTHRELFVLASGAIAIDTPGMRELRPWDAGDGLEGAFSEIAELAQGCRFRDCRHAGELGCAVTAAVEAGELGEARLTNFRKLERELAHVARQSDQRALLEEKRRWKRISKAFKQQQRDEPR